MYVCSEGDLRRHIEFFSINKYRLFSYSLNGKIMTVGIALSSPVKSQAPFVGCALLRCRSDNINIFMLIDEFYWSQFYTYIAYIFAYITSGLFRMEVVKDCGTPVTTILT